MNTFGTWCWGRGTWVNMIGLCTSEKERLGTSAMVTGGAGWQMKDTAALPGAWWGWCTSPKWPVAVSPHPPVSSLAFSPSLSPPAPWRSCDVAWSKTVQHITKTWEISGLWHRRWVTWVLLVFWKHATCAASVCSQQLLDCSSHSSFCSSFTSCVQENLSIQAAWPLVWWHTPVWPRPKQIPWPCYTSALLCSSWSWKKKQRQTVWNKRWNSPAAHFFHKTLSYLKLLHQVKMDHHILQESNWMIFLSFNSWDILGNTHVFLKFGYSSW